MKKIDSLIIGNITKDVNIDYNGKKVNEIGGAVYYSSMAAYNLGHNIYALTKAKSKKDLNGFLIPQKRIVVKQANQTSLMKNIYLDKNRENRISKCLIKGDSYNILDVPKNIKPKIYYLAGLLVNDFSPEFIINLSKKAPIAIDAQCLVRNIDPKTKIMFYADYKKKATIFKQHIHFLKVGVGELRVLSGLNNVDDGAKKLFKMGVKEMLIIGKKDIQIYNGSNFYKLPIKSKSTIGRTGRGDTCFSVYVCERLTNNINDSLMVATGTVSKKMEKRGGFSGSRADIIEYIKQYY